MHRIAIIEDDPPTSNMFRAWLAEAYPLATLEQFFDLESGVRAVESRVFDLVISDIDLGRTTEKYGGVRIAGMLKGKPIPVLIVSGLPAPDLYREIMFALDAWDYLEKPVTQPDFLNQVGHALRWRESQTKQVGHQRMSSDGTTTVVDPLLAIDPLNRVRVAWRGSRVALSMTQVQSWICCPRIATRYWATINFIPSWIPARTRRIYVCTFRRSETHSRM